MTVDNTTRTHHPERTPAFTRSMRLAVAAGVVVVVGYMAYAVIGRDERDALHRCQDAVRAASKNPSAAVIPSVQGEMLANVKGSYRFAWKHGDGLRLQNGYGAMLDTTAVCVTTRGSVFEVLLDGKKMR